MPEGQASTVTFENTEGSYTVNDKPFQGISFMVHTQSLIFRENLMEWLMTAVYTVNNVRTRNHM